jgi:glycosyltransferase involved in cell wall biosynthesis
MSVGRLIRQKGHDVLVEALPALAERFPELAVVVVGEGHLREPLTRRAAELGVANVLHLPGHRTDARMLLDAADVFVLPSRQEGLPLAALEAMDAGLPVVGTDVVGTAEVVADGGTGVLVRPGDAPALGAALSTLLADPELRAAQGGAGRRRYLAEFTAKRMAAETFAVYEDVLARVRRTPA